MMNRERLVDLRLAFWRGIVAILIVGQNADGFASLLTTTTVPTERGRIPTTSSIRAAARPPNVLLRGTNHHHRHYRLYDHHQRRSTVLLALQMSATQAYLDSLSGFGGATSTVPSLTSFAQTAAIFSDYDLTNTASFAVVLAENNNNVNGGGVDLSYVVDGREATMMMSSSQFVADAAGAVAVSGVDVAVPVFDAVSSPTIAAATAAGVEAVDSVKEDLWGLGSTVFESTSAAATAAATTGGARSAAQDTMANYWDNVVMKGVIAPWYEAAKAKQEELAATLLSEQSRELAVNNLLPKSNPLTGFSESFQQTMDNSFQGVTLPNVVLPEIPTLSKLADASLVDIFTAMGSTLSTIARGFWYVLTALVEFVTGGRSNLNDITNQIKYSIDSTMADALDTIRSSLYDLGQVTLQEAVVFLVQVVFRFVELLFTLVSSVCQAFTGQGLDAWLQSIGNGLSEQAILATNTLSSTVHDLSHASLTELALILTSYAVAVARVLVDSPRLLADAFSTSGAADLVQSTMSIAVESTSSLLGSTGGAF